MALAASPPPAVLSDPAHQVMSDALDEEIVQVRAEIQALTKRRKLLASSLLSSTEVQTRLSHFRDTADPIATSPDLTPLLESAKTHSQYNIHRLAFGATAFPFHDPSPELQSKNPLLGIRIDICDRTGRYDDPYYLFCVRAGDRGTQDLRIHRHTIPALVPLQDYEKTYLPLADEGYGSSEDSLAVDDNPEVRTQDLHGLVERVRHDLVSWRLRQETIELLREELEIPPARLPSSESPRNVDIGSEAEDGDSDDEDDHEQIGRFGVREVSSVSVDARQVRIVWADGRVGRLRISDQGSIEKAVVIGRDDRVRDQERILTDGSPRLRDLIKCLERVERRSSRRGK
ncbi:hypothetical protein A1O3_01062 [Capronia epimyces CBS 606.96]|uniref:Cenp-O kinetochore centromere component n=1 Tax=Capronia epimyces CBS 606.96 TaxID=1182542 RepID=W9YS75_9EURO|nr:uncharacterized protein A1O3_01062 [Capronia epimyces CBS 606.96]EXJ92510.1 hypothetical protein A1O3_01062 [Capronia epimyces CBS 606.96]